MFYSDTPLILQTLTWLVVYAITAVPGAVVLQFVAHVTVQFKPSYGVAYKALFLNALIGAIIGATVISNIRATRDLLVALALTIDLLLKVWIFGSIIKEPEASAISWKKGFLVASVFTAVRIALIVPLISLIR